MTTVIIPTHTDPAYTVRVDLSGVEFLLSFRYNARDGFWYLSVADAAAEPIVSGVRVVLGIPLLRNCVDLRRPAGHIIAIDTTNEHVEAGLEDLGSRVLLTYVE